MRRSLCACVLIVSRARVQTVVNALAAASPAVLEPLFWPAPHALPWGGSRLAAHVPRCDDGAVLAGFARPAPLRDAAPAAELAEAMPGSPVI